ncbi:MAG TPA: tail fiber domain-containing protein [Gemmatimonadota bacterium]|nr:tail fiber domain-containing protein [Gemmatimonadota bacterium]
MRTSTAPRASRRWIRRRGLPLALIAGALVLLRADTCSKESDVFTPVGTNGGVLDITPPLVTNFLPVASSILNDVVVMSTITDPQGSNGATPSGVALSGITAMEGATELTVTMAGTNMYNADISSLGDGSHTISWSAVDLAGNTGTGSQSFTVDRTDPVVSVTQMPSPTGMSNQPSVDLTYQFTLGDPHFGTATFGVFNCNTGAPWPEGTGGGQVEDQSRTYTEAGAQTATFRFFNGVQPGGSDAVAPYCFNGRVDDAGVTKSGQPAPNFAEFSGRVDFTWKAPAPSGDFTVGVNQPPPGWLHDQPGVSSLECKVIQTTPPQPGATFSATATGPTEGGASGVLTPQPVTGTLDANGRAQLQVRINRLGTYVNVVTVTVGSVQRSATQNITVLSAPNTCPVLSSIRFKRDVSALLPEDVRPLGLSPVAFRYVEPYGDPAVPRIGLIAEEVAEVFPEAVLLDADGRPEAIDYGVLTGRVLEEVESRALQAAKAAIGRLADEF